MNLPLVLLHGWGLTPQVWAPLRAQLSAARDVATPPLPGHADAAPAADRNLDAWCAALLPHLPERCVLCGWSLGAQLALALAQRHPERVARLVLIGASPRFVAQDDWGHGLEAATVDNFVRGFASDPGATLRRFVALQALGDARRRAVQGALNAALPAADAMQHAALSSGLHLLADTDLRATIARLPHPTLLVHGAGDSLMPPGAARWLADSLPQARLALFDDCGHAPFLSRPAECAALIEAFADA